MSNNGFHQFQKFQSGSKWYAKDYFIYNVGPGVNGVAAAIANGATANASFQIQADSDFEWCYTTFFGYKDGATTPIADNELIPINILITDGGSGRNLFNQAMPINTFAGLGREPYQMPRPRIFMGKSSVNVFFQNFGPDTIDNFSISFHGNKIFDVSN